MMAGPIGREAELALGAAFLDTVGDRSGPAALLLVGAAGIGKSTILRAVCEEAAHRGARVLRATPTLAEGELAYAALSDLLRNDGSEAMGSLPEPQRHGLRMALLLEPPGERGADPRSVAAGLVGVLETLARRGPLLVAIDDAQWLDEPSRRAIAFALRRLDRLPVGILLGLRGDPETPAPLDLARALAPDRLTRLVVQGLTLGALFHVLRERSGRPFGRSTLARIADWSRGNPLYALEIGRAIAAAGAPPPAGEPPPVSADLADALGDRLRGLPPDERRTLLLAATAARPTVDLVQAASRRLRWRLRLVTGSDLIAVADGAIVFGHPLFRAQAVSVAAPEDRRAAHRALAALALEPEERARHLALAAVGADPAVADALDVASRAADGRGAPEVAAELAELAWRLTPPGSADAILTRRLALGRLLARLGDTTQARSVLTLAVREGPPGPTRALAGVALALLLAQSGEVRDSALQVLSAALLDVGLDRSAKAEVELAWSILSPDQLDGLDHARAALALVSDGPPRLRARALASVAQSEVLVGNAVPWLLLEEAVAIEVEVPPERVMDSAAAALAWASMMADDLPTAHARHLAVRQQALERGDESSLARIDIELAQIDLRLGRWDELPQHAAEAIALAERDDRQHDRILGLIQLAALAAARGDRGAAEPLLDEAGDYARGIGDPFLAGIVAGNRGTLALAEGDAGAARSAFAELDRHYEAAHFRDPSLSRYQGDQLEALVELGDLDGAASLADAIEAQARRSGRRRTLAFVARGRALLAAARGDLDEALAASDRSWVELAALGMRYQAARSRLVRGVIHRRRREKRLADEDLRLALAEFEALGAPAWALRARRELARVGRRPRAPSGLTETERVVARLAAEGHTNREIAALAFMSPRTVEGVLSRAYAKLGVGSRAELGRVMAEERGSRV